MLCTADTMEEGPRSIEEPQAETWVMFGDTKLTDSPAVRFFSKVHGGLQKHNKDFPLYLKNFNFIEVSSSDLCDVILNFCPFDSEVGPCIEAILKETRACKPTILALMHHTKDPAYVVQDNSSIEKELCKKDIHIVDFLYHEDIGLLKCENNDSSIKEILGSLEWDMCEDAKEAECPSVRVHEIVPRSVKNHISAFKICLDNSPNVTKVATSEWSDITLAFCPIVSRVGTDIEATLKDIEDSKPSILVVMHHTFDEQYVIPNTKRFGRNKDILIVDCLFHQDLGLLPCKTNEEALEQIKMHLMHEERKKKTSQSMDSISVTQKSFGGFIDYTYNLTGYSLGRIKHLISFCLEQVLGDSLTQPPSEK